MSNTGQANEVRKYSSGTASPEVQNNRIRTRCVTGHAMIKRRPIQTDQTGRREGTIGPSLVVKRAEVTPQMTSPQRSQ